MADLTPETVSTELTKCADRVDLWLGLSCPAHAIPRPEIAALVTWVRTSVPSPEVIAADRALNAPGDAEPDFLTTDELDELRCAAYNAGAADALERLIARASLPQAPAPAVQPSADSLQAAVEAERDALRERVAAMEAEWDAYGKARAAVARATEREECAAQLDALGCDHCAAAIRARTTGDGA